MAKLPNVKSIKTTIIHTETALREFTTMRNELATIRRALYASGHRMLLDLAKSITDGSGFFIRSQTYNQGERNSYPGELAECLSSEQRNVLAAWQQNGRRPLSEIEKEIETLTLQLDGLKAALPTPEKVAEVKAKIDSLCEQSAEKVREFRAPYAGLKQDLSDILDDLPDEMESVNNARRVSDVITAEVHNLREAYDLEANGGPYVCQLSEAEIASLEALMGRLIACVRRGYLPESNWPRPAV